MYLFQREREREEGRKEGRERERERENSEKERENFQRERGENICIRKNYSILNVNSSSFAWLDTVIFSSSDPGLA